MITLKQQEQSAKLMKDLVQEAWENSNFKDKLIEKPVETIESFTGNKISENLKFVVEDQTDPSVVFLNIPRKIELENLELTDEQLEVVSGGEIGIALGVIAVVAIVGSGYAFAAYNDNK